MTAREKIAALIAASALAGCASSAVSIRTTNSPSMHSSVLAPGTSYSSAAISADVTPGAYVGVLLFGYFLSGFQDDYRRWLYGPSWRQPPELADDRSVVEQDCSQPMDRPYANLRCK